MLGLPKGEVFLAPWDRSWEEEFRKEEALIRREIGEYVLACHHIGSTAVPGLSAKPIIDIAVEVGEYADGDRCAAGLARLGYRHRIIPELPERHYFSKGEPRTHQIHLYAAGNAYLRRQIAFRDCLRKNENLRNEYQKLKETLAAAHRADKLAYAEAKSDFIERALSQQATLRRGSSGDTA
jgi:GrpB-like predicted nucleotidyltransferase (UPF0157 family)